MGPRSNQFDIMFAGLKDGTHDFRFQVDEHFFELHEPLGNSSSCKIEVDLQLTKTPAMLTLAFSWKGEMVFPCDRCLDDVAVPIEGESKLYVKFGEHTGEASEDVLILPATAHKVNVSQYIYEFIVLSVPSKRVHPEGVCNNDVIRKLDQIEVNKNEEDNDDPRWNILKELDI